MTLLQPMQTLPSPWDATFSRLVATASRDILILSPYITQRPVETLLTILKRHHTDSTIRLRLVTDFSPASIAAGALDVSALVRLSEELPKASLTHLPRLHAKIYVADHAYAVVTSANMTDGGLSLNYEFGLCLRDPALVRKVREDAEAYAELGADVTREALAGLKMTAQELVALRRKAEQDVNPRLRRALNKKSLDAQLELLRIRARGKTTHGIFAETLKYLLARSPQRTVDLHRMIQRIHPDLCDDSIDRVIDGVHFGKKWKHHVRTAQQYLKRSGIIAYDKGCWYRTDQVPNGREGA